MAAFKYDPIDLGGANFRLLILLPGVRQDIWCEIFQAELNEREPPASYEALSYTWGTPDKTHSVTMNGAKLRVTFNLYIALRYLRDKAEARILWVDALCIDQENKNEREHQVQQMGEIYKRADRVIFWLGLATHETDLFMDFLLQLPERSRQRLYTDQGRPDRDLANLQTEIQPALENEHSHLRTLQRKGLKTLLSQSWYKRVWILQEVANARAGLVCCGEKSIPARLFACAPRLLDIEPDPRIQAVLDIMPGPVRNTSWWSQSRELYTVLRKFGESEASDSRDMIYALLGICSNAKDPGILRADYNKTPQELIRDVTRFCTFAIFLDQRR